jgi:CheY-like chemotaxis protein
MEEDVQRSKDAGFVEHLTKPIDPAKLEAVIHELTHPKAAEAV